MVVVAVLLLLAVAVVVALMVISGSTADVSLDWDRISTHLTASPLEIFVAGALTLLVAELAFALIGRSQRKRWATRRELKRLRRSERHQSRTLSGATASTAAPITGTAPSTATPSHGRPAA